MRQLQAIKDSNDVQINSIVRLVIIFFIVGSDLLSLRSLSFDLPMITPEIFECFNAGGEDVCRAALIYSDKLKRQAAMKKDYSCQTLFLGLGAEIIMAEHKNNREKYIDKIFKQINSECYGSGKNFNYALE